MFLRFLGPGKKFFWPCRGLILFTFVRILFKTVKYLKSFWSRYFLFPLKKHKTNYCDKMKAQSTIEPHSRKPVDTIIDPRGNLIYPKSKGHDYLRQSSRSSAQSSGNSSIASCESNLSQILNPISENFKPIFKIVSSEKTQIL